MLPVVKVPDVPSHRLQRLERTAGKFPQVPFERREELVGFCREFPLNTRTRCVIGNAREYAETLRCTPNHLARAGEFEIGDR